MHTQRLVTLASEKVIHHYVYMIAKSVIEFVNCDVARRGLHFTIHDKENIMVVLFDDTVVCLSDPTVWCL